MPVLSIGEIKYMITLHEKILQNFGLGNFWENIEEIRIGTGAEFRPQIGYKPLLLEIKS